jgi:hypothetical protein
MELPPIDPSTLFCDAAIKAPPNTVNLESVTSVIRGSIEGGVDTTKLSGDGDDPNLNLADTLKRLSIVEHNRFLGKSSQASLIQVAIQMKNEYVGKEGEVRKPMTKKRPEFSGINKVRWPLGISLLLILYSFSGNGSPMKPSQCNIPFQTSTSPSIVSIFTSNTAIFICHFYTVRRLINT